MAFITAPLKKHRLLCESSKPEMFVLSVAALSKMLLNWWIDESVHRLTCLLAALDSVLLIVNILALFS